MRKELQELGSSLEGKISSVAKAVETLNLNLNLKSNQPPGARNSNSHATGSNTHGDGYLAKIKGFPESTYRDDIVEGLQKIIISLGSTNVVDK